MQSTYHILLSLIAQHGYRHVSNMLEAANICRGKAIPDSIMEMAESAAVRSCCDHAICVANNNDNYEVKPASQAERDFVVMYVMSDGERREGPALDLLRPAF